MAVTKNILVVYGTSQGQTAKIAGVIRDELQSLGHAVQLTDCRQAPSGVEIGTYDAVIAGASVHASGYPRAFRSWARRSAPFLNSRPSLFFSVCLGVLQREPAVQSEERKIVADFLGASGWRAGSTAIFAGALPYTKYNFILKRLMRRIAAKAGGDTDMSRDFEYTDWREVRHVARDFGASMAAMRVAK